MSFLLQFITLLAFAGTAAGLAFDDFDRQLARPGSGPSRPSGPIISKPIDLDLCKSDADCAGDWICVGIGICVPPAKEPKPEEDDEDDDDKKKKTISFGLKARQLARPGSGPSRPSGPIISKPIDLDLCKSDADCAGDWICVGIGICVPPAKEPKPEEDEEEDDDDKKKQFVSPTAFDGFRNRLEHGPGLHDSIKSPQTVSPPNLRGKRRN